MIELTPKQRKHLKKLAHNLSPVVTVGKQGISDAVLKEFDQVLECHELIKAKVTAEDRDEFREICKKIETLAHATLVATIGRIGIYYRAAQKPEIVLPSS